MRLRYFISEPSMAGVGGWPRNFGATAPRRRAGSELGGIIRRGTHTVRPGALRVLSGVSPARGRGERPKSFAGGLFRPRRLPSGDWHFRVQGSSLPKSFPPATSPGDFPPGDFRPGNFPPRRLSSPATLRSACIASRVYQRANIITPRRRFRN